MTGTPRLDPATLTRLSEMLEQATPRPWTLEVELSDSGAYLFCITGNKTLLDEVWAESDATLAVAAINALPDLLDEVDRLSAVVQGVWALADEWDRDTVHRWPGVEVRARLDGADR